MPIPRGVAYSRPPMASHEKNNNSGLARLGLKLSDWFEKWFPDAFALALAAVAVVFVATLFALFTRFGGPLSAYASVSAGMIVWAAGKYGLGLATPYLFGLLAALAGYIGAAVIDNRRSP